MYALQQLHDVGCWCAGVLALCPAGVLQIEAMAQLGGLVMLDPSNQEAKEQFFFGGIEGCRFRRPVVPGDTLVSNTPGVQGCSSLQTKAGQGRMQQIKRRAQYQHTCAEEAHPKPR